MSETVLLSVLEGFYTGSMGFYRRLVCSLRFRVSQGQLCCFLNVVEGCYEGFAMML